MQSSFIEGLDINLKNKLWVMKMLHIISFHTPYDESTHHYLNEAFIKKMNKPFYVINTARGKVINTSDFIKGLKSKKILGTLYLNR